MRSKWIGFKQLLKDWDVDIILIAMVLLCLLLNAISFFTAEEGVNESDRISTELPFM